MSKKHEVSNDVLGAYRMWHQKAPKEVQGTTYDFPEDISALGVAMRIVYWSDKWEADGKGYHYEHDFDSRPPVYGDMSSKSKRRVDTARLLCVDSVHEQMEFAVLAEVCELSVDVKGEGIKTFSFVRPPLMLCTADKKSLVLLHDKPIVIRGGKMRVTERGIVN